MAHFSYKNFQNGLLRMFLPAFGMLLLHPLPSRAATELDTQNELAKQVRIMNYLEEYLYPEHLPRFRFMKKAAIALKDSLDEYKSHGHAEVFYAKQRYAILFQSGSFFKDITSDFNAPYLDKIKRIATAITSEAGLKGGIYPKMTESVFMQIQKLITQLLQLPIGETLSQELRDAQVEVGFACAAGSQGDRLHALITGATAHHKIRRLYPEFHRLSTSDFGFAIVMEIQNLNEFYGEYSQANALPARLSKSAPKLHMKTEYIEREM